MANTILTPTIVTRAALAILHNNLRFTRTINRQYDDSFTLGGAKGGQDLKIRLPNQYTTSTGAALSAQDTTESSVTLTVSTQRHVDTNFTTAELTQSIQDFSERILEPAMSVLASNTDYDAMQMYNEVYNLVGTPGTTPSTARALLAAHTKLNYNAAPLVPRFAALGPDANEALVDGLKGLFNPSGKISDNYEEGMLAKNQLGYRELFMTQSVRNHTNGLQAGTPLVNGASQTGSSLITDGWSAAATITKGTVFTLAGVYGVNPETKASTGALQQFVVTADATADGSGNATLSISPSIVTSGATQTVSGSPADNAGITVGSGSASTAYAQNLAYHRDAFAIAFADLEMPRNVHFGAREVMDGISMRVVRDYRIGTDDIPCRIDILYGYKCVRPQLACRITG